MTINTGASRPQEKPTVTGVYLKLLLRILLGVLFLTAIFLFLPAGRLDWAMAWALTGLHLGLFAIPGFVLLQQNPDLIAERSRGITADTKGWDKVILPLSGLFYVGVLVLAGLDFRFGWSPLLALAIQIIALVIVALGFGLFGWAMVSNKYFTTDVRIQDDRAHTVATGGPYRYVRHPGYAGFILGLLAMPLALGSLWALIPGGLAALLFIVRTALEDRTLQNELDGYKDYAARVRYRLLPGIW